MKPAPNNIVIIDCWDHLTHDLELAAKQKISEVLKKIEGRPDWNIYVWNGKSPLDRIIAAQLHTGQFNKVLDFDDPLVLYNIHHHDIPVRYFFCGFHANFCVFFNTIGIDKYLQIADSTKSEFWVLADATAALDRMGPCTVDQISWYNSGEMEENTALILNYRNALLQWHARTCNDLI